ncbi:MAG: hypothetical protein IJ715_01200 [Bacilli bacterium]|nr:hypothetical protein [Bacilli bacterium]
MREAIGNSFVLNFIITFVILFILIFVGTTTYTKAFKVKNKIVDTIENYDGKIATGNRLNSSVSDEINEKLGQIGYRIDPSSECKTDGRFSNGTLLSKTSDYRYCVYKFSTTKGNYYGVVAYIYMEIPVIGAKLEFPVYGETKIFFEL